jgi:DNA primase
VSDARTLVAQAIAGRRAGKSGWIRANCPLCAIVVGKGDRHASLGVEAATGVYHCFRCSSAGTLVGGQYTPREPAGPTPPIDPPSSYVPLFEGDGATASCLAEARDYVLRPMSEGGRGLDEQTARTARIGACTRGPFAGRVIVPVFDAAGAWRWFVGRAWRKCEKPYLYPSGSRGGLMYNGAALGVVTDVPLLVVEGAFDALAHWPDAAAVLGKPTDEHIAALAAAVRPVCFVLDGDATDEALACALALHGRGHRRVGLLGLGPRVDPDEIPREVLSRLAREACDQTGGARCPS